jgi:hypothetical protein
MFYLPRPAINWLRAFFLYTGGPPRGPPGRCHRAGYIILIRSKNILYAHFSLDIDGISTLIAPSSHIFRFLSSGKERISGEFLREIHLEQRRFSRQGEVTLTDGRQGLCKGGDDRQRRLYRFVERYQSSLICIFVEAKMKRRIVLLLALITVCLLAASAVTAQAPRVWVLHNSDPDFTNPPFDDSLKLLDTDGNIVMAMSGFNTTQSIGSARAITASPVEQVCWIAEYGYGAELLKVDTDGNILLAIGRKMSAVDIGRDGTVYGLLNWGNIYGTRLLVIDSAGNFLDSSNYSGFDVVVDEAHSSIWIVGADIDRLDMNLQHQFTIDPIKWCAMSVDFASDGTAWIVEREHPEVSGSVDRLLNVAGDGQILDAVDLPFSPMCVRVDRITGMVWITGILGAQGLYRYDPVTQALVKIAGFRGSSLAIDPMTGLIWCATWNDVRAYSTDGVLKVINTSFEAWNNKYITIGALPVYVDVKPGSCPNPLNTRWAAAIGEDGSGGGLDSGGAGAGVIRGPKPVLPVAILGTADFDVTDIDPSTLTLEGVPILRWSIEDVSTPVSDAVEECECTEDGPDGYLDLSLKFDKGLVINALGDVYDGEIIALKIIGELFNGAPIVGSDCVVMIGDRIVSDGSPPFIGPSQDVLLAGNHPNPFNAVTRIGFTLPSATDVRLEVFNVVGQKVATLVNGRLEAGEHVVIWDGSDAASGIYLYRLATTDVVETMKMLLLK